MSPSAPTASHPLLVIAGPTASGKTTLALTIAERFSAEIVSCDSVAIYRGLDVGSAKPSREELARIPHHCLDILDPDQPSNAGDYSRHARAALDDIRSRGKLPIVAGGTGLYLRALLHGLAPAPPRDEVLRDRLRSFAARRGSPALHRLVGRFDPAAAQAIHPNDTPKLIRSLEVTLGAQKPQSEQWASGRDPLRGFHVLQIGLNPPRAELYARINARAASMFTRGLIEETREVHKQYGDLALALGSLGYCQALEVIRGEKLLVDAVMEAQTGHRHYAKRQLTWFRREPEIHWLAGFGDDTAVQAQAMTLITEHLQIHDRLVS